MKPSKGVRASLASQIEAWHQQVDPAVPYLSARAIDRETIDRFQLGFDGNRLTIPYLTPAGPWTVKRRCIQDHDCKQQEGHQKYLNEPGAEMHLFNAQVLRTARYVILTEGEFDAIACTARGFDAVGYPGTQHWGAHPSWRWAFDSASEIVIPDDGDKPGRESAAKVAASLRKSVNAVIRVIEMPDGEDCASVLLDMRDQEFLQLMGWL